MIAPTESVSGRFSQNKSFKTQTKFGGFVPNRLPQSISMRQSDGIAAMPALAAAARARV